MAPRTHVRRRDHPGAVPRRSGHAGRPHLSVLVPVLSQTGGPVVSVLHPRELPAPARGVRRVLSLGLRAGGWTPVGTAGGGRPARGGTGRRGRAGRGERRDRRRRGRARLPGHRDHLRRHGDLPRPAPRTGDRHHPVVACRHGLARRRLPTRGPTGRAARCRLPAPARGAARVGLGDRRGQRPVGRRDLPRPGGDVRALRPPRGLDHPVPPVLPHGVHQAHPGDDLPGVHRPLPRSRRRHPGPVAARATVPLQGHRRRVDQRDPRSSLPPVRPRTGHRVAGGRDRPGRGHRRRVGDPPGPALRRHRPGLATPHGRSGDGHRLLRHRSAVPRRDRLGDRLGGPRTRAGRRGQAPSLPRGPRPHHRPGPSACPCPERRGAHPRAQRPGPGDGGDAQQHHPAVRHRSRGLPRRITHRVPAVRRPGRRVLPHPGDRSDPSRDVRRAPLPADQQAQEAR